MKTYGDILRHHIKNNNLLSLIEYYNKNIPHPIFKNILSEKIDNRFMEPRLCDLLLYFFNPLETEEGLNFWNHMSWHLCYTPEHSLFIYDWKHIDEWFEDEDMPEIIKINKEKYVNEILEVMKIKHEKLFSCDQYFIFSYFRRYASYDKYEKITEDEKEIIKFITIHNRFPNDFDK